MTANQKPQWEKEFDREFEDPNYKGVFYMYEQLWRVKSFIRSRFISHDELLEKIEGMKKPVTSKLASMPKQYNQALHTLKEWIDKQ